MQPFARLLPGLSGPTSQWNNTNNQGIMTVGSGANQNRASWPAGGASVTAGSVIGTVGRTAGKWYCEMAVTGGNVANGYDFALTPSIKTSFPYEYGGAGFGVDYDVNSSYTNPPPTTTQFPELLYADKGINLVPAPNWATPLPSVTVMIAADLDNFLAWFGVNGTWQGYAGGTTVAAGNPATGAHGIPLLTTLYYPGFCAQCGASPPRPAAGAAGTCTLKSYSSQFAYTRPAGFSPWGGS